MTIRVFISICLLAVFQLSHAAVYKWTDANGQVHFGDRPPSEASEQIDVGNDAEKGNVSTNDRHQKIVDFVKQQEKERAARRSEELEASRKRQAKEKTCRKLRARLVHMESISTFYELDDEGKREYVSESENERIRKRFKAEVHEKCG